jgi:hypothetical protein
MKCARDLNEACCGPEVVLRPHDVIDLCTRDLTPSVDQPPPKQGFQPEIWSLSLAKAMPLGVEPKLGPPIKKPGQKPG